MKVKDLAKLETVKLQERLQELRGKVQKARFDVANNQLKKVRELRNDKKEIARILTILKIRQMENNK